MTGIQISAVFVMAAFYFTYFLKMLLQKRRGIHTDQIGKGAKPKKVLRIEILMKIATFGIVPTELLSIILCERIWNNALCWIGVGIAAAGVIVFSVAMYTMRDSWRAGIPESDKTELITTGIYRFSRNPAFLGFDLMYIGLLLAFFNFFHLIFVIYAIVMLHLQILQEEAYLEGVFGKDYMEYKNRAGRYFSIK